MISGEGLLWSLRSVMDGRTAAMVGVWNLESGVGGFDNAAPCRFVTCHLARGEAGGTAGGSMKR